MRDIRQKTIALLCLGFASVVPAQQSQPAATVPRLVRFSGSFRPANGMPAQPVESVTLSVYSDQTGGAALWQETQNVAVDGEGKYSVLMGSTQNDGVPMELLNSGEPRWLGVQFNRPGEAEQPRVLMASVPYALKSVDAETLGGKPASAYLLAGAASSGVTASGIAASGIAATTGVTTPTTVLTNATTGVKPRATNGTAGFIGVFTDATDIGNSVMQQSGGFIGVGTVPGAGAGTTPSLDLRTQPFSQIGMAQTTDYLTFFSSDLYGPAIYWNPGHDLRFGKGGASLYNAFGFAEQMRIQSSTGNLGIGTQNPLAKLEVNGNVQADGNVTITTSGNGLIFPDGSKQTTAAGGGGGGGSITGVTAGTDLTGGGTSGVVTLNLNTALVPTLAGGNTFTASNSFTGSLSAGSLAVTGTAQAANLVASQNINFTGSVLYQGIPVLQVFPGGSIGVGLEALESNMSGATNTAIGNAAMFYNTSGSNNVAVGTGALQNYSTPSGNTAVGFDALLGGSVVSSNTGVYNTASGALALEFNSGGSYNTASGAYALNGNTGGTGNTAVGVQTLGTNTTGNSNTAIGVHAMEYTASSFNTASGYEALQGSVSGGNTGGANTANGYQALQKNTTASNNTATGYLALAANNSANDNTAVGYQALQSNSGSGAIQNTAIGSGAMANNTVGTNNTAVGFQALAGPLVAGADTGIGNTAIGTYALTNNRSGSNNIAIGYLAGTFPFGGYSNNIHIGSQGSLGDSATIRIGGNTALGDPVAQTSFFVAGVTSANLGSDPNAALVVIDTATGQLGVTSSSRRYKEDIEDMGEASRDLMRLRPVTFRYKKPLADGSKPIQYGLIAEEVDEVYPDLVAHSADGQIETVKYQVLDSMLLNEVQKQNQHAQQQDETIRGQQEQIKSLEARLAALEGLLLGRGPAMGTAGR